MYNLFYIQVRKSHDTLCQERMKSIGDFINVFDSSYLLVTNLNAENIYNILSAGVENSNIFIIKCDIDTGAYYGRTNKTVWAWINEQRPKVKRRI